jgi:hypothetical protein
MVTLMTDIRLLMSGAGRRVISSITALLNSIVDPGHGVLERDSDVALYRFVSTFLGEELVSWPETSSRDELRETSPDEQ